MVKIFVGNLAPKIEPDELKTLFEQFGKVSECDVIRNYGFVHMDDEDEAKKAFDNLNNYTMHGRQIHLEYSTSKLRKAPGMDDVCFRCGAKDHKTHNCPIHDGVKSAGAKRSANDDYPVPAKRAAGSIPDSSYYSSRTPSGYGGRFSPLSASTAYGDYYGRPATAGGGAATGYEDPIIPRPPDRSLAPLYEEYLNARERYYYYRDRLERELYAMRRVGAAAPAAPPPPPPSALQTRSGAGVGALPSASSAAGMISVDQYGRSRSPSSVVRYPELYYGRSSAAGAPPSAISNLYDHFTGASTMVTPVQPAAIGTGRSLYDPYP